MALPDISARFTFRQWTQGSYSYKEASGELGVPGKVATHRSVAAQRAMSAGTGEHAGHLIGIQFGAPGDVRNLGLQNPNMNTFAPKKLQAAFRGPGGSSRSGIALERPTESRIQNPSDGEGQVPHGGKSTILALGAMDRNQAWGILRDYPASGVR